VATVEVVAPIAVGIQGEGLNSVELAAKLGVSKRTAQNWAKELGKTPAETKPKGKEAIAIPPHIFKDGKWYPTNKLEE
jgi:transposase